MVFYSSISLDSVRLAWCFNGQVFRPLSVGHTVGGCLWLPRALLLEHLSRPAVKEKASIVAAAVAAGVVPVAGIPNTERGLQRRKPNVLHNSHAAYISSLTFTSVRRNSDLSWLRRSRYLRSATFHQHPLHGDTQWFCRKRLSGSAAGDATWFWPQVCP